ncbi:MAG: hypothetical protein KDA73_19690 [Rhodobacteraceae bacterium]|nr:hypothetical protein [Paracoccaceae bacterium]
MQVPATSTRIATFIAVADIHARRLTRRLRLAPDEMDDLRQDLLADLLRRLPAFDPERGSIDAFVRLVLRHHGTRIASRVMAERRARGGAMLSIDLPLEDADPRPLKDRLAEEDGLSAWSGHVVGGEIALDLRHDLGRVLALLADRDRRVCIGLAHRTLSELAVMGFGSRSALYRRLADLRFVLAAHGLGPAWDDRATA